MMGHNATANGALLALVERVEQMEAEKKKIGDDIKEIYAEAKGLGFDTKTIKKVVQLRAKDPEKRAEEEAMLEIYMAALGMLNGTPLGDAARRRLTDKPAPQDADVPPEPEPAPVDEQAIEDARAEGRTAATEGKRIIDNPYMSNDPRRAAWDEGWCAQSGNDGMSIPDAWRRKDKPKSKTKKEETADA